MFRGTPAQGREFLGRNGRRVAANEPRPLSDGWPMLLFLEQRRQRAKRIEAQAEALIQRLGPRALNTAHMMERDAYDFSSVRYWRSVRKAVARETEVEVYRLP